MKTNYLMTKMLFTTLAVFFFTTVFAQDVPFDGLPNDPLYGDCYAKCKVPDTYESVTIQKMVAPEQVKTKTIPAVYETRMVDVLVKEASTKMVPVPAVYETVTERVVTKDAATRSRKIPAKYKTESRQVLVQAESGRWVKKKKSPNCFSANPEDCYVMCWEKIPAKYKTVREKVLASAERVETTDIPAQYSSISKRVIKTPATVREVNVPAVYKKVRKRVLVTPERKEEQVIPARYETITEKRLVSKGGFTQWTQILCEEKTSGNVVRKVQQSLVNFGYNPGPIDGVMGSQTKTALRKFQKDTGLPVGNLNVSTLKALKVDDI